MKVKTSQAQKDAEAAAEQERVRASAENRIAVQDTLTDRTSSAQRYYGKSLFGGSYTASKPKINGKNPFGAASGLSLFNTGGS